MADETQMWLREEHVSTLVASMQTLRSLRHDVFEVAKRVEEGLDGYRLGQAVQAAEAAEDAMFEFLNTAAHTGDQVAAREGLGVLLYG